MRRIFLTMAFAAMSLSVISSVQAQIPGVTLIGVGTLPGTAHDKSGLRGTYTSADGKTTIPCDQLGSFGSGLAYTGVGSRYVAVNDRGFDNGTVPYQDRFQIFDLTIHPAVPVFTPILRETRLLTRNDGQKYIGQSSAFKSSDATKNLRLDPEGIRVGADGSLYISDEYGPNIYHFSPQGRRIGVISVPAAFTIAHPNADGDAETAGNTTGRVTNRGLEGLAITPDGQTLVAIMQSPLIQDGGREGVNIRILKINLATGVSHQYVYPLDTPKLGVSEMVAVNNHQFLVDERDSKVGAKAKVKDLYEIDLNGATDVSAVSALPAEGLPAGVVPVRKHLFLNLVDPRLGLAGADFPEKIEGLAFGPDLPDKRHLLMITNDNDLIPTVPNYFYAVAITPSALPGYQAQKIHVPFR
jgi:hypothetical protein